jgi:hypothetical protein
MNCKDILNNDWDWGFMKDVHIKPSIPIKKLQAAISSYAFGVPETDVLVLLDDTVFGGAKEGLILTSDSMYCKQKTGGARAIHFENSTDVSREKNSTINVDGKAFFKADIIEHLTVLTFTSRVMSCLEKQGEPAEAKNNKQETTKATLPPSIKKKSFLKFIESDAIFSGMAQMSKINVVGSLGDMLSSKQPANLDIIKSLFFKYIYNSLKTFRKAAEEKQLSALKNDVATLEIMSFIMARFMSDMAQRNIKPRYIELLSQECLAHVFSRNNGIFSLILENALSYTQSEEPVLQLLIRLGCGNIEGRFKQEYHYTEYSFAEFPKDTDFAEFIESLRAHFGDDGFADLTRFIEKESEYLTDKVMAHPVNAQP